MDNIVDILKENLDKIANFNLAIFGICFTIFTVIYSFLSSKKDSLLQLNESLKINNEDIISVKKFKLTQLLIAKWKRINLWVIILGSITLLFYLIAVSSVAFIQNKDVLRVIKNGLLYASVFVSLSALIFLIKFVYQYFREIKSI